MQQRIGPDRELPNERPVVGSYEQEAGGCTGSKESHGNNASGALIPMGESYAD